MKVGGDATWWKIEIAFVYDAFYCNIRIVDDVICLLAIYLWPFTSRFHSILYPMINFYSHNHVHQIRKEPSKQAMNQWYAHIVLVNRSGVNRDLDNKIPIYNYLSPPWSTWIKFINCIKYPCIPSYFHYSI